jgi:hypothetical protein
LVVAVHLEYVAIAVLLVADQEDASKFWAYEERTTLGLAADKLALQGILPRETISGSKPSHGSAMLSSIAMSSGGLLAIPSMMEDMWSMTGTRLKAS